MNDRLKTVLICAFVILFGITLKVLPNYFYKSGMNNLNAKNYVKAYNNLRKAHFLDPADKDIKYYYVKSLTKLRPTETVQKELYAFSQNKNDDAAKTLANLQIAEWRSNITSKLGNNYIEQVPYDKNIVRWSVFPIRVYLENILDDYPSYYKDEVIKAFKQWFEATGFISFVFVDNAAKSEIKVSFTQTPQNQCDKDGCKYVAAFTIPTIKGHYLKKMSITLYDKDLNGNYFSDKELYNTILHEIGHALGIMGHSYNSDDLMYMSNTSSNEFAQYRSDFQYLSAKDVNTIALLYKLIPNITNIPLSEIDTTALIYAPIVLGNPMEISERKLKEAQNYIKKAPELSGGYVDLAIAYAELKRYAEAIRTLEKAASLAKTTQEQYIVYYNLAVLYMNMQKFDRASENAYKAKKCEDTDEINELINNIKND